MRTFWIVLLVVVAGAAGWALLVPSKDAAGKVGVNTLVENTVTTASAGNEAWAPAVRGADVFFGDRIATAADSRLEMRLLDSSNLSVAANARLTIDRFVYDPSRNAAGALVSVVRGAFRYVSGGRPERVSFSVSGADIGIRGTVIEGVVGPQAVALLAGMPGAPDLSDDDDSAAVIILRSGAAEVRLGGQVVVLDQPGQAIILTRRRLYPVFAVTRETTRRFDALLPRPLPDIPESRIGERAEARRAAAAQSAAAQSAAAAPEEGKTDPRLQPIDTLKTDPVDGATARKADPVRPRAPR